MDVSNRPGPGANAPAGADGNPPPATGGDGDSGDHRAAPADHPCRDRADPRRQPVPAVNGRPAGDRPDPALGPEGNPGAADPMGDDAAVSGAIWPSEPAG